MSNRIDLQNEVKDPAVKLKRNAEMDDESDLKNNYKLNENLLLNLY